MVLLPRRTKMDFLMRQFKDREPSWSRWGGYSSSYGSSSSPDLHAFIRSIHFEYQSNPSAQQKDDLERLCRYIVGRNTAYVGNEIGPTTLSFEDDTFEDDTLTIVANICLSLGNLDMAHKALSQVKHYRSDDLISGLAAHFKSFTFDQLIAW